MSTIAGSDSHFSETIGDAYTIIDAKDTTLPSILEALRLGRTELLGRSSELKFKMKMVGFVIRGFFRRISN